MEKFLKTSPNGLIVRCLIHKEKEAELVSDGEIVLNTSPNGLNLRCLVQRENSDGEAVLDYISGLANSLLPSMYRKES